MAELRSEPKPRLLTDKGILRLLGKEQNLLSSSLEVQTEASGWGSWLPLVKNEGIRHPAPGEQYVGNNLGKLVGKVGQEEKTECLLGNS